MLGGAVLVSLLGLMLLGDPLVVRLEEVGEVELTKAVEIADLLASALSERTGRPVSVEDPSWEAKSTAEVRLRIFGGPIHLQLEASAGKRTQRVLLRPDLSDAPAVLAEVAAALYEAAPPKIIETPVALKPTEERDYVAPAIVLGGGVLAAITGAILGANSQSAAEEIEGGVLFGERHRALADRQETTGLAANLAFGVAGAAVVTAAVLFFVD